MIVEKNVYGAYVISDIVKGQYVSKQYYYYTKKEAIIKFKREVNKWKFVNTAVNGLFTMFIFIYISVRGINE